MYKIVILWTQNPSFPNSFNLVAVIELAKHNIPSARSNRILLLISFQFLGYLCLFSFLIGTNNSRQNQPNKPIKPTKNIGCGVRCFGYFKFVNHYLFLSHFLRFIGNIVSQKKCYHILLFQ